MGKRKSNNFSNIAIILFLFLAIIYVTFFTDLFRPSFLEGMENPNISGNTTPEETAPMENPNISGNTPSQENKSQETTPQKNTSLQSTPDETNVKVTIIDKIKERRNNNSNSNANTRAGSNNPTNTEPNTNNPNTNLTNVQPTTETFTNMNPASVNSCNSSNNNPFLPYGQKNAGPVNINKFFFDDSKFTPQCCPSSYSSNSGCGCMTPQQIQYIASRGGNGI